MELTFFWASVTCQLVQVEILLTYFILFSLYLSCGMCVCVCVCVFIFIYIYNIYNFFFHWVSKKASNLPWVTLVVSDSAKVLTQSYSCLIPCFLLYIRHPLGLWPVRNWAAEQEVSGGLSEWSFICIYSCSPPLTLLPELHLLWRSAET